jgi:hypothetical protein
MLAVLALAACTETAGSNDTDDADTRDTVAPIDTRDTSDTSDADTTGPADTSRDTTDTGDTTGTCSDDGDCRTPCAIGRCEVGVCVFAGPDPLAQGCALATDANGPRTCVPIGASDRSSGPYCAFCNPFADVGNLSSEAFAEGFESGSTRILVDKLTPSPASWTIATARAATGTRSLYFGDARTRSYDVGERAAAVAATPGLALPGEVDLVLTFQIWADTERTPGFDRLRVLVLPPRGEDGTAREVWSSDAIGGTTLGEFLPVLVTLGPVRAGERIGFEADSIDGIINDFEGFYIDDLRIASRCCASSSDCDDGNACTVDQCADGFCAFTPTPGCCLSDVECEDGDACTADQCILDGAGGRCARAPIPGCCETTLDCNDDDPCTEDRCRADAGGALRCGHAPLCCASNAECDDGDACTAGTCVSGECRYTSTCCRSDLDCDDGLACTNDGCELGTCRHDFSYAAGCCIPDVVTERFDQGLPQGWLLSAATNNIGWLIQATPDARSGTSVLYYGHPTLGFYESGGRNTGTATTRAVRLPDGVDLTLSFMLYLDVEPSTTRDLFRIDAVVGANTVTLLDKSSVARATWKEVQLDLSWAAGQNLQLRFVFDTVDGAQNTSRGILVDDLRLLSSCLPRRCAIAAECATPLACSTGRCESDACSYTTCAP